MKKDVLTDRPDLANLSKREYDIFQIKSISYATDFVAKLVDLSGTSIKTACRGKNEKIQLNGVVYDNDMEISDKLFDADNEVHFCTIYHGSKPHYRIFLSGIRKIVLSVGRYNKAAAKEILNLEKIYYELEQWKMTKLEEIYKDQAKEFCYKD